MIYPLTVDGLGRLQVTVSGAGSGGTSSVDETGFSAGVSAGTPVMGYDSTSGELLIAALVPGTRNLQVSVAPISSNTCTANAINSVGAVSTQVLASNSSRKRMILQNLATQVAFVLLGSGTASQTNFTFTLPACGSAKDGSSFIIQDTMWQGAVQVIYPASGGLFSAQENT